MGNCVSRQKKFEAEVLMKNREYYQENLRNHPEWVSFFSNFDDLILGKKISEEENTDLYSATSQSHKLSKLVARVSKSQSESQLYFLSKVIRTWTPRSGWPFEQILGEVLLDNGRVAFVMEERWGSLRKLINIRCNRSREDGHQHGPPFGDEKVIQILWSIASNLKAMHDADFILRDIKAANVFLLSEKADVVQLINFESFMGTIGTGFWTAPENLEVVRQRRFPPPLFTKEGDIYSFGMLCYEVISGRIPFEDHPLQDYDLVLERRQRPKFPCNLKPALKKLVHDCWQHDPIERPSVAMVVDRLALMRSPK